MKCPNCGCENHDNATYCNLCQTPFKPRAEMAHSAPPHAHQPSVPGKQGNKSGGRWLKRFFIE
jgi:hypothetical protein